MTGPTEAEVRDAAWLIVKDSKGMNETGHGAAVRWARAYLGLDDGPEVATSRSKRTGHTHGWALVDGEWRCVQDYYLPGNAPETGCSVAWRAAA